MRFMLDTNIVSFALRDRPPAVLERLRAASPDQVCVSAITLAELRFGAARSAARARYDSLIDVFVSRVAVAPFDAPAAAGYATVRAGLAHEPIGGLDMLIAGHALAMDVVLVTNNRREFDRVPMLQVEDWSS
jgi:tRNA(fMet)-specific endonuclease VapC